MNVCNGHIIIEEVGSSDRATDTPLAGFHFLRIKFHGSVFPLGQAKPHPILWAPHPKTPYHLTKMVTTTVNILA